MSTLPPARMRLEVVILCVVAGIGLIQFSNGLILPQPNGQGDPQLPINGYISDECEEQFEFAQQDSLTNDTEWVEELMYFFELGDSEIELLPEEKEIVLILGLSGTGKSTLAQVIAGSVDNPLRVECNEAGNCIILDEDGYIGNHSTISETFLPNLVLDTSFDTHTAFYDCPGFHDTRSTSADIANAYFVNKVALHGNDIKILLVIQHSDTNGTGGRNSFVSMLKYVITLIKNIDKYLDGIGLAVNRMFEHDLTEDQIRAGYTIFLNLVHTELQDQSSWSESDVIAGRKIIDSLLRDDTPRYFTYFPNPTPRVTQPFENFANLRDGRERLKLLVRNKLQYAKPSPGGVDFGFAIKPESSESIKDAVYFLNTKLLQGFSAFGENSLSFLISIYEDFVEQEVDFGSSFEQFEEIAMQINSASYPTYDDAQHNITRFMEDVVAISKSFATANGTMELDQLAKIADYLIFMEQIRNNSQLLTPNEWVAPIRTLQQINKEYVKNATEVLNDWTQNAINLSRDEIVQQLSKSFDELGDGNYDDFDGMEQRIESLISASYPTFDEVGRIVTAFIEEIRTTVAGFVKPDDPLDFEPVMQLANYLDRLQSIEDHSNAIHTDVWINSLKSVQDLLAAHIATSFLAVTKTNVHTALMGFSSEMFVTITTKAMEDKSDATDYANDVSEIKEDAANVVLQVSRLLTNNDLTLNEFISDVLQIYENMEFGMPEESVANIRSLQKTVHLIESLGKIDWQSGLTWTQPASNIVTLLDMEYKYVDFLHDLFQELSESPVQIGKIANLATWRNNNALTDIDNFLEFWDHFVQAGITTLKPADRLVIYNHLRITKNLQYLNKLLDFTLLSEIVNKPCPALIGSTLTFKSNYITLDRVVTCIHNQATVPENVEVLAKYKVFINVASTTRFSDTKMKVFVIAKDWDIENLSELSLNGKNAEDRKPPKNPDNNGDNGLLGLPGGPASDFIGIYHHPIVKPVVNICGGVGGKGQDGADGIPGVNGINAQTFIMDSNNWIRESECYAGSGWIAIGSDIKTPYECTKHDDYPNDCEAGNSGASVLMLGTNGTYGQRGGAGGSGGVGGDGGYRVFVDVSSKVLNVELGNNGANGSGGEEGGYGRDGRDGDSYLITIDDRWKYEFPDNHKRCQKIGSKSVFTKNDHPVRKTIRNVPKTHQAVCFTADGTTYDIDIFKPKIKTLVEGFKNEDNPFVYNSIREFGSQIEAFPYLWSS